MSLTFDGGYCIGSMLMLQGLSNVIFTDAEDSPALNICAPSEVKTTQYARVVVRFLQEHPELLHENGARLALSAAIQSFPCKPQGQ